MKKKKKRRVTSLFYRILGGIAIPLLILLAAFTGLILKRELNQQKRYAAQQGKIGLEALNKDLEELLDQPEILESAAQLKEQIQKIQSNLEIKRVDLVDANRQASLLATFPDTGEISDRTLLGIQTALAMKREGKRYYLAPDEHDQRLLGYLPIKQKDRSRILVATAEFDSISFKEVMSQTIAMLGSATMVVLIVAFLIAFGLTVRIVRPIRAINRACREMLAGKLGLQVKVETGDEIEMMAGNFNKMSQALLAITIQAEDANPLTQLPGNREITKELTNRIEAHEKFVFFHVDIDHFKAYNDHYGLARGDEVLRRTGELIGEAIREVDLNGNFLGHQGGDDFVLMLDPVKAPGIADLVCKKFDGALKEFYDKADLERGYFMGDDERSDSIAFSPEVKRHPLMSITLAGISNLKNDFQSSGDVLERAVHVKKKGKKIPYSKFLIEE